ncbi:MAG: tetratricopeptide repeat protein [Candidatus Gastranaerophilales bacterium]|nr:tetratricopeptide repeat protein [Candidatus Gastranaerophilales bacterium]
MLKGNKMSKEEYCKKAEELFKKKEFNEAIECLNKVIELNPNRKEALGYYTKITICYCFLKEYDKAFDACNKRQKLKYKNEKKAEFFAKMYLFLIRILIALKLIS